MRINRLTGSAVLLAVGLVAVPGLMGGTLVVPVGFDGVEGAGAQNTAVNMDPRTLQTVFSASELTGMGVGAQIIGVAYRLDGAYGSWPPDALTFSNYEMILSTSLNPPGSLSLTFADNVGPDAVTVRSGPLTIPANAFPGGQTPNPFGFLISFTTPYTYLGGDLLITLRHTGNGVTQQFLDAATTGSTYQSIAAPSDIATMAVPGFIENTRIIALEYISGGQQVSDIPEPGTCWLLGLGLLALPVIRKRLR